jgi:protease-4
VRTGNFGEKYTVTRPLTAVEKDMFQRELEKHYRTFVHHAAEGRNVTDDEILSVAGGRVWTGSQAQQHKLVDILGGFDDAVKIAAEKAGISGNYKLRFYPKRKTLLEQVVSGLEEDVRTNSIKSELGEKYVWYQRWKDVQHYHGAQARMPYELLFQ